MMVYLNLIEDFSSKLKYCCLLVFFRNKRRKIRWKHKPKVQRLIQPLDRTKCEKILLMHLNQKASKIINEVKFGLLIDASLFLVTCTNATPTMSITNEIHLNLSNCFPSIATENIAVVKIFN